MKKQRLFYSNTYTAPETKCFVLKTSSRFLIDSKTGTAGDDTTFTDEEW